MANFDQKTWNEKVFQKYLSKVPKEKLNTLVKSGILQVNNSIASRLKDGVGGNYIVEPIKGILDGDVVNYDGETDIPSTSRKTYEQGKIVVGRAKGWTEKDFSTDITGEEFLPLGSMAGEVGEYFEGVEQDDILAILAGIFAMADAAGVEFKDKHTHDISGVGTGVAEAGTLNKAITKASGDKKAIYALSIMHSDVATELENLELITYLPYTDANGIQREVGIGRWNGRMVIVDDDSPVEEAEDGNKYTTYVLGRGFIEYADCGVKVPNEMDRDAAKNGGETTLYVRQRKLYAPKYISFTKKHMATASPTKEELANGENWEIVNNGDADSKTYISHKLIPAVRIISKVN